MNSDVILSLNNVVKDFSSSIGFRKEHTYAVNGITLDVFRGETLGIVGESGCGKSTLGRVILRLLPKTCGEIIYDGINIYDAKGPEMRILRKKMQIVFQDPAASLNPRMKIGDIIAEPLRFHGKQSGSEKRRLVRQMLETVHLPNDAYDKYPHELSGGQQQRVGIARALITEPDFLVCDEAVSALDVSVRAQVLNLMEKLKKEMNLTYVFVSHDMSVLEHICDRVMIMYLGKVMEVGTKDDIFNHPKHPYTQALLSAVPSATDDGPQRQRIILEGDIPSPVNPPEGCRFRTRCPHATEMCATMPCMTDLGGGHKVACHLCAKDA